jgi:hypothetical protein
MGAGKGKQCAYAQGLKDEDMTARCCMQCVLEVNCSPHAPLMHAKAGPACDVLALCCAAQTCPVRRCESIPDYTHPFCTCVCVGAAQGRDVPDVALLEWNVLEDLASLLQLSTAPWNVTG